MTSSTYLFADVCECLFLRLLFILVLLTVIRMHVLLGWFTLYFVTHDGENLVPETYVVL